MKRVVLFMVGLAASVASAGVLVPGLDDSTVNRSYTEARHGIVGEADDITGGEITLAARFSPDVVSMTGGPVIVIEDGGTTFGTGLYMSNGNLVFVSKNGNSAAVPESLNDTDFANQAIAVTLGAITPGVENVVYASYDANNGELFASINGVTSSYTITNAPGNYNLDGNKSISFLGSGVISDLPESGGSLGGLTELGLDTVPTLHWLNASNMVQTEGYDNQLGQVFGAAVPEPSTIALLSMGALAIRRRR